MTDSTLALISTLAWIALVGVLLGLFGRSEGGAWSIAGSVARGVRDWAGHRGESGSPATPAQRSPSTPSPMAPHAEVDDLGQTPIVRH